MIKKMLLFLIIASISYSAGQIYAQQLLNLDATNKPRFELTEKTWPVKQGQAVVCLWQNDKLAAFTITIDDNNEQDIAFWESMYKNYGFNFTWFVITEANNTKYNVQAWTKYINLANQGHAIDGHDDRNWSSSGNSNNPTDMEYASRLQHTKEKIDKELAGTDNKCHTYAYPFGEGNETMARKTFIAIRGVKSLLNKANQVNYLNVNSISGPHIAAKPETYILPLIDKTKKLYNTQYYRGWGSTHFHNVAKQNLKDDAKTLLRFLKDREDKIWISTFSQVAAYSQSRDTHTLKITSVKKDKIRFILTDKMNDKYFNIPLTVKIRVNNSWKSVLATQNGLSVASKIILHNGNNYVLVKSIPDAGETIIKRSKDKHN